jgi:hypothetical protein
MMLAKLKKNINPTRSVAIKVRYVVSFFHMVYLLFISDAKVGNLA